VVPGQHRALHIAVPHQHAMFEHFAQPGAAVHPALCRHCASHCAVWCSLCRSERKAWWASYSFLFSKRSWTVSASFCRCFSNGGVMASSQWGVQSRYSMLSLGSTFSIRKGMIGIPLATALSTSRITWLDPFASLEKTKTSIRVLFSA
jgi:hypothetical protein